MSHRLFRLIALGCALWGMLVGLPEVRAQEAQRYENPALGVAFDLPAGWEVSAQDNRLVAAASADLQTILAGGAPDGLSVHLVTGSFSELGITDASELPALLARLVPAGVTAPQPTPISWGGGSGYTALVTTPDGLTTQIALLAIAGGRVAVVRGLAPSVAWDAGAGAQFDALAASLTFTLPQRDTDLAHNVTSNDGGVFWQYQAAAGDRPVRAGGITLDAFQVIYVAAGPAGVLTLNQASGEPISVMGPWNGGDYADVTIGPDTKLYLANVAADTSEAITVVDRAGNYVRGWGLRGDGDGEFAPGMPVSIATTPAGNVWTVSEGHASGAARRLYQFDAYGNLLLAVDLATINPNLAGVHLDANPETGAVYLIGEQGLLNVADPNGVPLVVDLGAELFAGTTPLDLSIAPDNNLVVALPAPGLNGFGYLMLSPSGALLDVFGLPYDSTRSGPFLTGEYLHPAGLIAGPDAMIYAAETDSSTGMTQVQAFRFTGDGRLPLGSTAASSPAAEDEAATDPAAGGGAMEYGQTVRGALNNRYPAHEWVFTGRAGDHVIITLLDASGAGLLDPKVNLLDVNGNVIASNDDAGIPAPEGVDPRDSLLEFDLPGDGQYTIEATRFGGRGEYTLTLDRRP